MAEERLQKILARAGYGSRRSSEELISAGRVRINGVVAELGGKADPQRDTITVDNHLIAKAQAPVYIALHKPQGILSEVSPDEPRETVRDLVPVPGHMFIVGRLDLESEGLILLTNDGELANRLTHPRYGHEKEYRVLVGTRPDAEQMDAWRHGIVLEDGHRTAPAQVRLEGLSGKGAWMRVILNEGRKRQIREMGRMTGLPVFRIIRIRIGSLELGELKPGQWRELRPDEVRALRSSRPVRLPPRAPRSGSERTRPLSGRTGSSRVGTARRSYEPGAETERPRSRGSASRGGPPSRGETANRSGIAPRRREDSSSRAGSPPRNRDTDRNSGAPRNPIANRRREEPASRAEDVPGDTRRGPARPPRSGGPRSGGPRPAGASRRPAGTGRGRPGGPKPGGRAGSNNRSGPARGGPKRSNRG